MEDYNGRPMWSHRMRSFQCKQADINRLVMHYLITDGYKEYVQGFEEKAKKEMGAQKDTEEYRTYIKNAVREGQIQYALNMARRLYPRLYESDNYMFFHMQQLRLLELVRESEHKKVKKENTLEVVKEEPEEHPLGDLRSRQQITNELNSALMEPKMMFLVQLILWAQDKLDNDGCVDYPRLDLTGDDFEVELKRALQRD